LHASIALCRDILEQAESGLQGRGADDWMEQVKLKSENLAQERRRERSAILEEIAAGQWEPTLALGILDAMRWLDRIGYHSWRLCHYLGSDTAPLNTSSGEEFSPEGD